jgi:outer membrane protein
MKKVILFAVVILMGAAASAQKFGHINTNELLAAMPETKKAQDRLKKIQDSLNTSYADMIKEYNEQDSIIRVDSAKWTPAKKDVKFGQFQQLAQTLQGYSNAAQEYLQQQQEVVFAPVQKIAFDAIQAVAKANGYTYVFNKETLLVSPASDDILPLVKKYLKLPDAPPAK